MFQKLFRTLQPTNEFEAILTNFSDITQPQYGNNPIKHDVTHHIKTHDSESRGQEEAGRTRRTSELFTRSTALKFVNALNKPPLKLSLSYQGLSKF